MNTVCPAALSIPDRGGPWPAVIMFPDAGGMRDTMRRMGERLSGLGYVVVVPDFYYRNGPYEPVDMRTAVQDEQSMEKIMGMMRGYSAGMVVRDARALVDYLDSLAEKKPAEGEPPAVSAGEPAPLFSGSVRNPDSAGVQAVDLAALLGPGGRPATRRGPRGGKAGDPREAAGLPPPSAT